MTKLPLALLGGALLLASLLSAQSIDNNPSCVQDEEGVFILAEKMPGYSKGEKELFMDLLSHDFWPEMDLSCWFHKVQIHFVVAPDGQVSDLQVELAGQVECSDEARLSELKGELHQKLLKSLQQMWPWIPGECDGVRVPVRVKFPLHVHLSFR